MQGNEKKVKPGVKVSIPASTWNGLVDLYRASKRGGRFRTGVPGSVSDEINPRTTVKILNGLSTELSTFDVVKLGSPLIDPAVDPFSFKRRVAFGSSEPDAADNAIGIMAGPADLDEMATAVVGGITLARVKMNSLLHEWANPVAGNSGWLESVECGGQARILHYTEDVELDSAGSVRPTSGSGAGSMSGSHTPWGIAVINLIGAIACDGGATALDYGTVTLGGGGHSLTSATGVYEDVTGMSLVIPEAGDYLLQAHVNGQFQTFVPAADYIEARLYDVSTSAMVPGCRCFVASQIPPSSSGLTAYANFSTGAIMRPINFSSSRTIKLQASTVFITAPSSRTISPDTTFSFVRIG